MPITQTEDAQPEAQRLAQEVGAAMYDKDNASRGLGIDLLEIRPGYARMEMRISAGMLNGHQTCHGGFIFTLADSAFAFACNSRNHATVASACGIDFLAPAYEGDLLHAEAQENILKGRTGVYDVVVTNQVGVKVALFRGKSHRIQGEVIRKE